MCTMNFARHGNSVPQTPNPSLTSLSRRSPLMLLTLDLSLHSAHLPTRPPCQPWQTLDANLVLLGRRSCHNLACSSVTSSPPPWRCRPPTARVLQSWVHCHCASLQPLQLVPPVSPTRWCTSHPPATVSSSPNKLVLLLGSYPCRSPQLEPLTRSPSRILRIHSLAVTAPVVRHLRPVQHLFPYHQRRKTEASLKNGYWIITHQVLSTCVTTKPYRWCRGPPCTSWLTLHPRQLHITHQFQCPSTGRRRLRLAWTRMSASGSLSLYPLEHRWLGATRW